MNHKISDKKAENEQFVGIEEQDVQGLCHSKLLSFMHIHPHILVSTAEDTHCLQVEMQVAELIHHTGSVNLILRAGNDFMNEKVAVTLDKIETNKQKDSMIFAEFKKKKKVF